MQIIELAQCSKELDFQPLTSWPGILPAIAWDKKLLTAFDRTSGPALNFAKETNLTELLSALYPKLGVFEQLRLHARIGRPLDERFRGLSHDLPMEFQNWADQKQVSVGDLAPLRSISTELRQAADELLGKIAALSPTRQVGCQILELAIELLCMKTTRHEVFAESTNAERWLKNLLSLRKPMSSSLDSKQKSSVERMPWPPQVRGQWVRRGDETGIEIQLRAQSPAELKRRLEAVSKLTTEAESTLWST